MGVSQLRPILCSDSTTCWITSCSTKYPSSTSHHPYYCYSNSMNSIWGNYFAFNFRSWPFCCISAQGSTNLPFTKHLDNLMSQPVSLWITSNRLCPHSYDISGTNTVIGIWIRFIKIWSFLCCCLLHNTQHKCLYSLSTSAQLASSSVEGVVWLHAVSALFADWSLYLETRVIRLFIRVKANLWIHTSFLHNNVPLIYCGHLYYPTYIVQL